MDNTKSDVVKVDRRFAVVEEWVIDANVSDRAFRLYAVLVRYADNDTHKAYPAQKTLAMRLRCSTKSVQRATEELVEKKMLEKTQRHNSSIVYTVITEGPGGGHHSPGGWTPVSGGVDTTVQLTRTTELEPPNEPKKKTPSTRSSQKITADDYEPSKQIVLDMDTKYKNSKLETELQAFKDHHMSKDSKFIDWDRAFRTWLNKAEKWNPKSKAKTRDPNYMAGVRLVEKMQAKGMGEIGQG